MMSAAAINEAAATLAADRILAELSMVESFYCDHMRGVPVADAAGITADYFSERDLQLIWSACTVCHEAGASREQLHRVTAAALIGERFWNSTAPIAPPFSPIWCRENLSILAGREYHCAPVIRRNARRLIDLHRRQESARQYLADAWAAMADADAPATQTISIPSMRVRAVA